MLLFGSQDFYNERVAEGDRQYNIYFTLNDSANVSMNNVAPVIKEIAAACGIDQKNVISMISICNGSCSRVMKRLRYVES